MLIKFQHSLSYSPRLPPVPNGAAGPSTSHATYDPPKANLYSTSTAGSSSIGHYDPYAPPKRPTGVSAPLPTPSSSSQKVPGSLHRSKCCISVNHCLYAGIRFKDSPFFAIEQAITSVIECPGKYLILARAFYLC